MKFEISDKDPQLFFFYKLLISGILSFVQTCLGVGSTLLQTVQVFSTVMETNNIYI